MMTVQLDPQNTETVALFEYAGSLRGQHVLEIGCGDGRLTRRYAAHPARVTAIDPNPDKIALACENLPIDLRTRVEFIATDIVQFGSEHRGNERFDLAILAWSL